MRAFILKCSSPEGQKLGCLDGLCHVCRGYDLKVNLVAAALTDIGEYAIVDKDNWRLVIPPYISISSGEFVDEGLNALPETMREAIINSVCESLAKLNNLDSYTPDERRLLNDIIYFLWLGVERHLDVTLKLDEKFKDTEMGDFWQEIKDEIEEQLYDKKTSTAKSNTEEACSSKKR